MLDPNTLFNLNEIFISFIYPQKQLAIIKYRIVLDQFEQSYLMMKAQAILVHNQHQKYLHHHKVIFLILN